VLWTRQETDVTEIVLYRDAEYEVTTYLRTALAGRSETYAQSVDVGTRKPTSFEPPVVAVRRAGGLSDSIVIDHPRVDVQVWHTDDAKAHDLTQLCRALLFRMPGSGGVIRVRDFLGPTPIPDPETSSPRYLFTVELHMRGVVTT
jgi:hypothetical protein